jgi:hypothetical protein
MKTTVSIYDFERAFADYVFGDNAKCLSEVNNIFTFA